MGNGMEPRGRGSLKHMRATDETDAHLLTSRRVRVMYMNNIQLQLV